MARMIRHLEHRIRPVQSILVIESRNGSEGARACALSCIGVSRSLVLVHERLALLLEKLRAPTVSVHRILDTDLLSCIAVRRNACHPVSDKTNER